MNVGYLLGILKPYTNNSNLLVKDQSTNDIIKEILEAHKKYASEYDKISEQFWKGNVKDTCKNLFKFLKKNVKYSIEPDSRQSVKSPSAILATGKYKDGGNDCKHFSLWQAGILDSLKRKGYNVDWCYRFANYKIFQSMPHHVFIVVFINGKEYWCDPVLNEWNERKPYINKIDKKMSLYSISGIGRTRKYTAAKITLVPARKAFLLLVRINFDKFALKLFRRLNSPKRDELINKWRRLGGRPELLISTVNKAVAKYQRKHPNKKIGDPVAASIISAATPIIAALFKFLKPEKADEITEAANAVQQVTESFTKDQQQTDQATDQSNATVKGIGAVNPYLLYGGIGLGILYLVLKKK